MRCATCVRRASGPGSSSPARVRLARGSSVAPPDCLAALEALASGTPVVASSGSAVGEVIGGTGGRVAAAHPIALADAVRAVLGEDGRQRRLGARTRAESFPWTRTVDLMLELHDRLGAAEPRLWPAA